MATELNPITMITIAGIGLVAYLFLKKGGISNVISNPEVQAAKTENRVLGYEAAQPYYVQEQAFEAQTKMLKDEARVIKADAKTDIAEVKWDYKTTQKQSFYDAKTVAVTNNYQDDVERNTQYGVNARSWFNKMFLPTTSTAKARRQGVVTVAKNIGSSIGGIFKKKSTSQPEASKSKSSSRSSGSSRKTPLPSPVWKGVQQKQSIALPKTNKNLGYSSAFSHWGS